jgi:hypothetical protein
MLPYAVPLINIWSSGIWAEGSEKVPFWRGKQFADNVLTKEELDITGARLETSPSKLFTERFFVTE